MKTQYAFVVLCLSAFTLGELYRTSVPVLTVCDALENLQTYNGKTVIIVGRSSTTGEGSWLDQECDRKLVTQSFTWPSSISTAYIKRTTAPPPKLPEGFSWDVEALKQKLESVKKKTRLRPDDVWLALYGRLETHDKLQVALCGGGRLCGVGFGHLSASPAQLVYPDDAEYRFKDSPR
jgi:hypothetical protein